MRLRPNVTIVALAVLLAVLAAPGRADDLAEKGREVFKNNQRAIVTVQIVIKTKFSVPGMGGQSNESKQDLTGTVVDASGLTVLALSACEPGDMIQSIIAGISGEDGDSGVPFKMDTELSDVKILLDDGTEMPAEVVLRDRDLDLAFIRPKTRPAAPMLAIDLAKSGRAQVLDQIITLNRLGEAAGRAYAVSVDRITAVVLKPRLFYVPDSAMTSTTMGSPAFTLDGNLLGVFVTRTARAKSSGGFGTLIKLLSFRPENLNLTAIILPAADILKAAKQAPEAKGDGDKKEETKESKEKK